MKRITIVEVNDVNLYPPVQSLVQLLLDNGYYVYLIAGNAKKISEKILSDPHCEIFESPSLKVGRKVKKWKNRIATHFYVKHMVKKCMQKSEFLWTTSMNSIRTIGKDALQYKNIMQLLELSQYGYLFHHILKFPVDEYARKSWKIVVPEINRAYIQKVWWHLEKTPYVLPNKPYSIAPGEIDDRLACAISKMKNEKRKIILYLGGIFADRNLEIYAKAISQLKEYVFYIIGAAFSQSSKDMLEQLMQKYPIEYLGAFNPPKHLALVKYAYIGLLPYKPINRGDLSELNALYCAPNKIFEYAGYGVPMVGSDVLGLRNPFEQWDIGRCCDDGSLKSILEAIKFVDKNHESLERNCIAFFDSIDLKKIVLDILKEEE